MRAKRIALWATLGTFLLVTASMVGAGASAPSTSSTPSTADWGQGNNTTGTNYTVTFTETGLPSGTNWSVVVSLTWWWVEDGGSAFNTSNTSSLTFSLPNGTYHFRVFPANGNESTPDRGSFTVNGTAPPPIAVHFGAPTLYTVTFTETGLAKATDWGVFVYATNGSRGCEGWWDRCCGYGWWHDDPGSAPRENGAWHPHGGRGGWGVYVNWTNGTSLSFQLPNGTYNYTVLSVFGYSIVGAASGSFNVSGASPAPIPVTFSVLPVYSVTFVESGLPNGTNWTVQVFGDGGFGHHGGPSFARHGDRHDRFEATSSGPTLMLNLTNGTYRYRVAWVDGYYANDSRGTFTVSGGSPPPILINFTAIPTWNVTFRESGLPSGTDWGVTITGSASHLAGSPTKHVIVSEASRGSVTFSLPRGHYHFAVLKLSGWKAKGGFRGHHFVLSGPSHGTTITFTSARSAPHGADRSGAGAASMGSLNRPVPSGAEPVARLAMMTASRV